MNIIFVSYDLSNNSDHYYHMANIANFLAQKHKYKTILYCDEKALNLLKDIPFSEIKILPTKIMEEIPRQLWSMAKIVALSEITEPSIVIDLDLFLFKSLDEQKLNNDIIYLHNEPYSTFFVDPMLEWFSSLKFSKIKHLNSNISHNCAMIGGQDYKLIKNVAKEVVELILENKEKWKELSSPEQEKIFNKKYYEKDPDPFFCPVLLIEQVWMIDLFKVHNKNVKIQPYFESVTDYKVNSFVNGVFHVWGFKDDKILSIIRKFSETELDYNKEYKDYNYDIPFLKRYENMLNNKS